MIDQHCMAKEDFKKVMQELKASPVLKRIKLQYRTNSFLVFLKVTDADPAMHVYNQDVLAYRKLYGNTGSLPRSLLNRPYSPDMEECMAEVKRIIDQYPRMGYSFGIADKLEYVRKSQERDNLSVGILTYWSTANKDNLHWMKPYHQAVNA